MSVQHTQPWWSSILLRVMVFLVVVLGWQGVTAHQILAAENCELIKCEKDNQSESDYLACIKKKQNCLVESIAEAQNAAGTLRGAISILNGKINLQLLQVAQTQAEIKTLDREITDLSGRIAGLDLSLDRLSSVLVERVNEQYKTERTNPSFLLLISDSFGEFLTAYKYIQLTQEQTANAMQRAETQKTVFDQEKATKEQKQDEVEAKRQLLQQQQTELNKQKQEQQYLLTETQNNEARYQTELQKTLDELEAIQSIVAGKGTESKAGDVKQGDQIASIIVGASPCSTGTHLHFEVVKDGSHQNPASYLKSADITWNNQPDGAFSFGGGWEWPLNNPAKMNQGYGMTYYASVKRSYGGQPHTGIDISSKSTGNYGVVAVRDGELFRGSIKCGGGLLRYVKVQHKDDGLSTFYLHVNY